MPTIDNKPRASSAQPATPAPHAAPVRATVEAVASAAQAPIPSGAHASRRLQHAAGPPTAVSLVELRARADDDTLDTVFQKHLVDFRVAFAEMREHAPSIVFFGGARLLPKDPYYKLAQSFGAALAAKGIPPKTGAGPGAMHAVPAEFIATRDLLQGRLVQSFVAGASRFADLGDQRTLGFNIKLPAEQKVSPAIESSSEIQQFAFRKFALYENVRGVVVFPGGFGTIDELMEVLVLKSAGKTNDPVVLAGRAYWQPILDAWRGAAARNGADLLAGLLDDVLVTDDPQAAIAHIEGDGSSRADVKAFESDPDELYVRMVRELKLARYVATRQATAITVLGGDRLAKDDPVLALVKDVASRATGPLRVGNDGQVARALETSCDLQKVLWADASPGAQAVSRHAKPAEGEARFSERIPHKEVLLRNSSAYLVLPCADRGKDELTTVLCQMQTGKLPQKPLVLIDETYWRPIVQSWQEQMLGTHHAYIDAADMELITYASSADDVLRALTPRALS